MSIAGFQPFSLFGTFRFAQLEMTKYQLQASSKWSFDFMNESPIRHANSQYRWEAATLNELPRFYHHIAHPTARLTHQQSGAAGADFRSQLFSEFENICPLARTVSAPSMVIQSAMAVNSRKIVTGASSASSSLAAATACSQQRKITGERSMQPLTASLWLKAPESRARTIIYHQILSRGR